MLSGGGIKGVQGGTGHAQASMLISCDDNRRMNAERFQQRFYSGAADEKPEAKPDPLQRLDAGEKQIAFTGSKCIYQYNTTLMCHYN